MSQTTTQLQQKVAKFVTCSVCLGDRISGDVVATSCKNMHNYCLNCILGWAASRVVTSESFSCPSCRSKDISLYYNPIFSLIKNEILLSEQDKDVEIIEEIKPVRSCREFSDLISWKQIQDLSKIAHEIFPLTFPNEEGIGLVLTTKQALILAKNFRCFIAYKNHPRTRQARKFYHWKNADHERCPPEDLDFEDIFQKRQRLAESLRQVITGVLDGEDVSVQVGEVGSNAFELAFDISLHPSHSMAGLMEEVDQDQIERPRRRGN